MTSDLPATAFLPETWHALCG